jgi:DNA-binding response OmpR family regulator
VSSRIVAKAAYDRCMILVVEDEPGIVDFVERGLRAQGFEVDSALDGETGLARSMDPDVELVVLDLMLPRLSGIEVLRRLTNARPSLPVIVLTAKGELGDRISGLDAGAIDYVVKPFSVAELGARIRAQLRAATPEQSTTLRVGGVDVDLISRDVRVDGELVRLSTTEFELLAYLLRNPGQVLTREQILRAVWGYGHDPGTNVVDVYIGYLRKKLSSAAREVPIVTVRSVGYRFDDSG